jgi:hypothetical protein
MPDDTFKEFVLDQLGALPELRAAETERGLSQTAECAPKIARLNQAAIVKPCL